MHLVSGLPEANEYKKVSLVSVTWASLTLMTAVLPGFVSSGADVWANGPTLIINELPILTIRGKATAISEKEQAAYFVKSLSTYKSGEKVTTAFGNGVGRIFLGGRSVFTITKAEAQAQLSTIESVTELWAGRISKALASPPLNIPKEGFVVAKGRPITIPLTGSEARLATISQEPAGRAKIERKIGEVVVTPNDLGKVKLNISGSTAVKTLTVNALAAACEFPNRIVLQVMGQPANETTVLSTLRTAIYTRLDAPLGATITANFPNVKPIAPGERIVFPIKVTVDALERASVTGTVNVVIENKGGGRSFEDELWYSNEPENIFETGQIYWGKFRSGSPVRLLAHHYSRSQQPLIIQYAIVNRGNVPASMVAIIGDTQPVKNPTLAGYQAGNLFFQNWLSHNAEVLSLPPNSAVPIITRVMNPGETISALASLHLLGVGESDVVLVANAINMSEISPYWLPGRNFAQPWQFARAIPITDFHFPVIGQPKHTYPNPLRQESFEYQAGGRFAFIRIGEKAIAGTEDQQRLLGNFGVQYLIEGTVSNPKATKQKVKIEFEASAGYSGAIFLVNGKYIDARLLQSKEQRSLWEQTLEPGQSEIIRIETIPLSGAHYPATITVSPG